MRKIYFILASMFCLLSGGNLMADTLEEHFDDLTVADNVMSNGWFAQGTEVSSSAASYYFVGYDMDYRPYGGSGKALYTMSGTKSNNDYYIIIPQKLTGEIEFVYSATCSSSYKYDAPVLEFYEVTQEGEEYVIGQKVSNLTVAKGQKWTDGVVDLGMKGTMVAIRMFRAAIDDVYAQLYDDEEEVKATAITAFTVDATSVDANEEKSYTLTFGITVENIGNTAITADDGAIVSLLDGDHNALMSSAPIELAPGETHTEYIQYGNTTEEDVQLTFYAYDDFVEKDFAEAITVDVKAYGARMAVAESAEGEALEGDAANVDMGYTKGDDVRSFFLRNEGNAPMTATVMASENFNLVANDETTAQIELTIEAGQTVEVGMKPWNPGDGSYRITGAVSIETDATNQQTFTFSTSAFVYTDENLFVDFDNNELPERWENTGWTIADGRAYAPYSGSAGQNVALITPKLTIGGGEAMALQVTADQYAAEIAILSSTDNGVTWNGVAAYDEDNALVRGETVTLYVENLATESVMLRLEGYGVYLDNIAGFRVNENDPRLAVYDSEEAEEPLAAEVKADFGFAKEDLARTYYIKNTGIGTLNVSGVEAAEGFTATVEPTAVAEGETATLTVAMPYDGLFGLRQGNITLTTDGGDFTVQAQGVAVDPEKMFVYFGTDGIPEGWLNQTWAVTESEVNGYAESIAEEDTLQTPLLTIAEGEELIITASGDYSNYYSGTMLKVMYSEDGGETWADAADVSNQLLSLNEWYTIAITDIPATANRVAFVGTNAYIQRVYGFSIKPDEPVIPTAIEGVSGNENGETTSSARRYNLGGQLIGNGSNGQSLRGIRVEKGRKVLVK